MIPVSVHDLHDYTPRAARDQAPAPVFVLRTPSLRQRAAWRRAIAASGARFVPASQLAEALREAVRALAPENADALVDLVDQAAAMSEGLAPADADVGERLRALELAMQAWPAYAELIAARAYWWEMSALLAFEHFVAGWRDVGIDYAARGGLVDPAVMERLPEGWVYEVGVEAITLTAPSDAQRGNSELPRPSQPGPATS